MASSLRSIQHRLVFLLSSLCLSLSLFILFFFFLFSSFRVLFLLSLFSRFFFYLFSFFRRVSFATLIAVDIKQIWDKSIVLWRGIVPTRRTKAERTELFRNFKCTKGRGEGEIPDARMRRRAIILKTPFRKWTFRRSCLSFIDINREIQFFSSFS